MEHTKISESLRARVPLFREEWAPLYRRMGEHPHAPSWNTECGDRLTDTDIAFVREFAAELKNGREHFSHTPPERLTRWILEMKQTTPWFCQKLLSEDIKETWQRIMPMQRLDMQNRIELIVPENAVLDRLVINPTSGTTGHPIPAPNHPRSVGCYDPLIQYALERHGVKRQYGSGTVAAIQICSQKKTITYHTVHSYLDGAGFAKINLASENWKSPASPGIYISEMRPVFLSGDPFSFMEYMRLGITYKPEAVLTTALHLEKALRLKMEEYFSCPVVDMYSLNETGPLAYSCPEDPSRFHILPHDIFAEIISSDGRQLPEGEPGSIAVSGGRNPYLPLLRYVTGDTASIDYGACGCGEKTPSLRGLQGRQMVLFRSPSGIRINSIDAARIIREYPVYAFSFVQRKDYSCHLSLSAGNGMTLNRIKHLQSRLEMLFNSEIKIFIDRDLKLDDRKNITFATEL